MRMMGLSRVPLRLQRLLVVERLPPLLRSPLPLLPRLLVGREPLPLVASLLAHLPLPLLPRLVEGAAMPRVVPRTSQLWGAVLGMASAR